MKGKEVTRIVGARGVSVDVWERFSEVCDNLGIKKGRAMTEALVLWINQNKNKSRLKLL